MEILMVALEVAPYVRATDAADAVASLGKALRQLGHNVTLAVPRQPGFEASGLLLARRLTPLRLPDGSEVPVLDAQLPSGVTLTLFDAPVLFDRPGVYGEGGADYADNGRRFALLAQAAAALVRQRGEQGTAFDIVHLHDVPAAMVPLVLRRLPGPSVPTVFTVHDVTRSGSFAVEEIEALGLPREIVGDEAIQLGGRVSLMNAGLAYADAVTTVSPSYARELGTALRAGELADAFAKKGVVGITNGIDYAVYNPATDPSLPSRYDAEDPSNKGICKTSLCRSLEMLPDIDPPLVAFIGSFDEAHGFDLVAEAMPSILRQDVHVILAGSGQTALLAKATAAFGRHRDRAALVQDPDAKELRRIYGAADLMLIPLRHAPCGTNQMIAHRYGAVSIARATGGLADTIVDCDASLDTGTGFLFDEDTPEALIGALERGITAYRSASFARLRRRIMRQDVGWDRPARRYLQIYRQTLGSAR